jgi:hypothetical protein
LAALPAALRRLGHPRRLMAPLAAPSSLSYCAIPRCRKHAARRQGTHRARWRCGRYGTFLDHLHQQRLTGWLSPHVLYLEQSVWTKSTS